MHPFFLSLCMKNSEILKKAIDKAMKNGWDRPYEMGYVVEDGEFVTNCYYGVIFDHGFAKAFWGEEYINLEYEESVENEAFGGTIYYPYDEGADISYKAERWKYELQMLALSEDKLIYLSEFL